MGRLVFFYCVAVVVVPCLGRITTPGRSDSLCWDKAENKTVREEDCPHGCCIDNDCGSNSECKVAFAIGIIIAIVGAICVCSLIVLAVLWWRKMYCFSKEEQSDMSMLPPAARPNPQDNFYPTAVPMQYAQPQPQPMQYPPNQGQQAPSCTV